MTIKEFVGCSLISFGPALALFCLTIARDPIRIIILISAAFFWLMALLLSSVVWFAIAPLRDYLAFGVTFSVLFQEFFRYLFYRLLRTAESGLQKVSEVGVNGVITPLNRLSLAYVAGLGFGIMSGAFSSVNVLADAIGPGTVGIRGDSSSFFLVSALTSLAFILLHTFWGVIFFQSFDHKKYVMVAAVVLSHLFVSGISLVNPSRLYGLSLPMTYFVLFASCYLAFKSAGGSFPKSNSPPPRDL